MKKPLKILAAIMSILLIPAIFAACSSDEPASDPVFTLDKTSVELTVGGNAEVLNLTIANVEETPVWASSNSSVATVSVDKNAANRATVKAVDTGAAVITATAGDRVAICAVTVKPGQYINLDKTNISMLAGTTTTITAETNVTTKLTYSSNNESVATVNDSGLITAHSGGIARITVSGGNASATCTVTVTEPYVTLNKDLVLLTLEEGNDSFQLEADSNFDVEWSSSDESVATVSEDGLVTARALGEAIITATTDTAPTSSADCRVKVKGEKLDITVYKDGEEVKDTLTLQPKDSLQLTATVTPEQSGDDAKVLWSVKSGDNIVSVSEDGLVTSLGEIYGEAVILATSVKDPDYTAECRINVPNPRANWIEIHDKASLEAALKSGNEGKSMYLTGDIDLDGEPLKSTMGKFTGTFDGMGYEIMNFTCNGLFAGIDRTGVVKDLAITCTTGRSAEYFGLFGEFVLGKLENCRFDITVNDNNMAAVAHHIDGGSSVSNVILLVSNPSNKQNIYAGCFLNNAWKDSYCAVLEGNVAQVFGPAQKTEAELKQTSLYAGWDETVWQIEDGEIPVLKNGGNIGEIRVTLDKQEATVDKGEFIDLIATVKPIKLPAADRAVIWESSNESVATVDENGSVTTHNAGTVTITATSVKDSTKYASCTITVVLPDTNPDPVLEITNKSIASEGLKIGNALTFTVRKNRDDGTVAWTSSDSSVATVANGKVTAISEGEVTVTATFTTDNGKTATDSVTLTVYGDGHIELGLSARSVSVGGTYQIDYKALGGSVSWTSSNTSVATVNASGVVSGVAVGKTVITAKVGEKTATMVIHVYEKAAGATEVSTPEQFKSIGNGTYYIVNDIDLGGETVNTFNDFAKINGLGYKVSNFKTPKLFTQLQGYVKNIEISCVLNGTGNFDGLFGTWIGAVDGTVENCIFDITFSGSANQCALVHHNNNGTMRNVIVKVSCEADVSGQKFPAWFESPNNGTVENVFLLKGNGSYSATNGATEKTEAQLKSAATFDESWEEGWVIIDGQMPVLKGALVTEPLKIKLDKTSGELFVGETLTLTATVTPTELTVEERAIKWVSEDSTLAAVANGVVTAKKAGTVTIKAVSLKDETVVATCTVTVKAIEISINAEDKISELKINATKQLNATVNCGDVTWETSSSSVATVSNGLVTAVGAGTVTITARSVNDNTKYDSITIQVKATIVITVELSDTTLTLDRDATATLTATVGNSDSGVTWASSNTSVATVDQNGKVTTHGVNGTANITATSNDDGGSGTYATATCKVTVTYVPVVITLKAESFSVFTGNSLSASDIATASKGELTLSVVSGNGVSIENGKIIATGDGTATVRVTSSVSYTDVTAVYKDVTVNAIEAKVEMSIDATKASLKVGEASAARILHVTLDNMPASPTAADIVWNSSNTAVVSGITAGYDADGGYTGSLNVAGEGKAVITATYTLDGVDYKVTCEVNAFTATGAWTAVYDLTTFKNVWSSGGGNYYLAHDLDLNGAVVNKQRDDYHAVFNGHGYTVSNFVTNALIMYNLDNSAIENVKFVCTLDNNDVAYGILGHHTIGGVIRNCYFDVTFGEHCNGTSPALANHIAGGTIENVLVVTHNPNNKGGTFASFAGADGGAFPTLLSYRADSSVIASPKGTDITEAQITSAATFDGWTAWVAVDGEYPRLASDWED
ncbi:MAG: Ig-like domain-containing protein [Clostridia bacterium]|nr:Ig-like domain-containing protein [Clostridia bacterium]